MKSPFEQMLRLAKRKLEIVSVHNDPQDYGAAYCGFVDCLGPEESRLRTFRRYGDPDGWFAFRLKDVLFLDTGGPFEHRIGYFAEREPRVPLCEELPPIKSGPIILGTLKQAKALGLLVSVGMEGERHTLGGLVKNLSTTMLGVLEIDPYGTEGGMVTLPLDLVLHVSVGTQDCLMAQHLHAHQEEFLKFKQEHRK